MKDIVLFPATSFLYRSGNDILLNTNGGHIIKTKSPTTDEGGVGYGASVLDTPLLIPDEQYIKYLENL